MGGKLQIFFDRYLVVNENGTVYLTKSLVYPKIVYRKYFDDITFRIGVIVSFLKRIYTYSLFCIFGFAVDVAQTGSN